MTKYSVLAFCVLVVASGWVLGIVTGAICSLLVAGGLYVARAFGGPFGTLPTWQILAVPALGLPVGIALGTLMFILGPGF